MSRKEEDSKVYKEVKRKVKKLVAVAKNRAWCEWYRKLDHKEGEHLIYKIAKSRERSKKDVVGPSVIKGLDGKLVCQGKEIQERWRQYICDLLNEENEVGLILEADKVEGPVIGIQREEVKAELGKMKKGKASGTSEVTVEMLKVLGAEGIDTTTELISKAWEVE